VNRARNLKGRRKSEGDKRKAVEDVEDMKNNGLGKSFFDKEKCVVFVIFKEFDE
jgi:hypothetical protein